jgi:site-specific DNA recombinase
LEAPERVADEYRRRLQAAQNTATEPDEVAVLDRRMAALRRGIGRLIDSYAEGVIERAEFEPRIAGLKARLAQLEQRRQMVAEAAGAERELTLIIGQLEEFAAKIGAGLDGLDWSGRQAIIRALVRRIEIDGDQIEIIFRVPPPRSNGGSTRLSAAGSHSGTWQHCTGEMGPQVRPGVRQPDPPQVPPCR